MKQTTPNNEVEEAEITETYKHSLLDTIRTSYEANAEFRCTRVLYIGRMNSSKQKEIIKDIHCKWIESQKGIQEITGALLFINNNLFYHMVEVDSLECLESLFEQMVDNRTDDFFQNIDPSKGKKNSETEPQLRNVSVKICCVSDEIIREFPIWSVRDVDLAGGPNNTDCDKNKSKDNDAEEDDDEEEEDEEALQNVLFETMKAMIEIGRQLCMKQDKDAAMKLFQSSQREIMNRFPTPDKIQYFMESKLLFDLQQFTDYFFSPINVKLESEYTWPVQPMIAF
eukprot:134793_1